MSKKSTLKERIIEKILSGEWLENHRLPFETELMEEYNLSKMTVRKTISQLKGRNILYSIKSKGVFVSPWWRDGIIFSLAEQLGADETKHVQNDIEIPKFFSNITKLEMSIPKQNTISYSKFYLKEGKTVAYTQNWVNNSYCIFTYNKIAKNEVKVHCDAKYELISSYTKMEKATKYDAKYLNVDSGFIPTTYSLYLNNSKEAITLRVTKFHPEHFIVTNHKKIKMSANYN